MNTPALVPAMTYIGEGLQSTADRRASDHWSILEVLTLENLVAACQAVRFRAQRIHPVVTRYHHIVELPDRAVAIHARHGVVDVALAGDVLRLADASALFVKVDRIDR